MKNSRAFTLVEVLIVVLIISIMVIVSLILLDPLLIVGKGYDAQRKGDLNRFKKQMEQYYSDKGCYPPLAEVCFSGGTNGVLANKTSCILCGSESGSPTLSPYYDKPLPCDPNYPTYSYLYAINTSASAGEKACPRSYSVFSKLSAPQDPDSMQLGCGEGGCGPNGSGYDYGVTSPNISLKATSSFLCFTQGGSCDNCSQAGYATEYESCLANTNCQGAIYATYAECIAAHPGAH